MNRLKPLFTGLLMVALAGAGWAYYRAQARRAATLACITGLDNRLTISNAQRAKSAKNTLSGIATAVNKMRNRASDKAVLQRAKEINGRTEALLDTLHQLRQSWRAADRTELERFSTQLNQYVAFIRYFVPDASLLNHASTRVEAVGWLGEFDTAREPKPAALALLTKLETQVRQVEAEALESQAQKVGTEVGFNKIGAFAIPASETVAPGTIYEAQLVLTMAASSLRPQMSADGQALLVDHTGQGLVQWRVPPLRPGQPDTIRAQWQGRVQLRTRTADTVMTVTVPYFIVKPRH